jgi:hypothetical protein
MATRRSLCQKWSDESSHKAVTKFHPEYADDYDLTEAEYILAYYNAFVKVYKPSEMKDWNTAMKYWFVEVQEYVTESDYLQYGASGKPS